MIFFAKIFGKKRLRARRVDAEGIAKATEASAMREGRWIVNAEHGGGVGGSYNYPAETECAVAVSDPSGITVVWCNRRSARSVTERLACLACLPEAAPIFDKRVKDQSKRELALELVKAAFMKFIETMSPMMVIAMANNEPNKKESEDDSLRN
jgi:hypothetical protein